MDAETVLVVILAVALAIFLILAITLTVMLIKVTRRVDSITDKAQTATDNIVNISRVAKKSLRPAVLAGTFSHVIKKVIGKNHNKRGRK